MTNKIIKSLMNINKFLDDDYQKLYDELKKYKKSHKKMCSLISQFNKFLDKYEFDELYENDEEYQHDIDYLRDRIFRRLNYF